MGSPIARLQPSTIWLACGYSTLSMHGGRADTALCASILLMSRLPDSWLSVSF